MQTSFSNLFEIINVVDKSVKIKCKFMNVIFVINVFLVNSPLPAIKLRFNQALSVEFDYRAYRQVLGNAFNCRRHNFCH